MYIEDFINKFWFIIYIYKIFFVVYEFLLVVDIVWNLFLNVFFKNYWCNVSNVYDLLYYWLYDYIDGRENLIIIKGKVGFIKNEVEMLINYLVDWLV